MYLDVSRCISVSTPTRVIQNFSTLRTDIHRDTSTYTEMHFLALRDRFSGRVGTAAAARTTDAGPQLDRRQHRFQFGIWMAWLVSGYGDRRRPNLHRRRPRHRRRRTDLLQVDHE